MIGVQAGIAFGIGVMATYAWVFACQVLILGDGPDVISGMPGVAWVIGGIGLVGYGVAARIGWLAWRRWEA